LPLAQLQALQPSHVLLRVAWPLRAKYSWGISQMDLRKSVYLSAGTVVCFMLFFCAFTSVSP